MRKATIVSVGPEPVLRDGVWDLSGWAFEGGDYAGTTYGVDGGPLAGGHTIADLSDIARRVAAA